MKIKKNIIMSGIHIIRTVEHPIGFSKNGALHHKELLCIEKPEYIIPKGKIVFIEFTRKNIIISWKHLGVKKSYTINMVYQSILREHFREPTPLFTHTDIQKNPSS